MKKFFAILLAAIFVLSTASCSTPKDDGNDENNEKHTEAPAENDNNSELPVTTPDEAEKNDIGDAQGGDKLAAATSESFTTLIEYSMHPYNQAVAEDKGMVEAITGYNGRVELTYHSFTDAEAAAAYFDDLIEKCPGEQTFLDESATVETCKKQDDSYAYMMVRIDNTILFGSCNEGFEELVNWFYALGYAAKA